MRICVLGATDDVAAHLAKQLKQEGHHVVAIDVQPNKSMPAESFCNEFLTLDMRVNDNCLRAVEDCDWVFYWPCKYIDRCQRLFYNALHIFIIYIYILSLGLYPGKCIRQTW